MNDNRHAAISDCKYALSLSETALQQHLNVWLEDECIQPASDQEYLLILKEIQANLYTNECLLKEGE